MNSIFRSWLLLICLGSIAVNPAGSANLGSREAISCLGLVNQPKSSNPSYDDGVRDYFAGKFQQAAIKLARASGVEPGNAMVHYYLANALVHLKDDQSAQQEYRICYALEPKGAVGDYCKQALQRYRASVPSAKEIEEIHGAIFGGKSPALATKKTHGEAQIDRSVTVIRRQVDWEKSKNKTEADTTADAAMEIAKNEVKRLNERLELDINTFLNNNPITIRNDQDVNFLTWREQTLMQMRNRSKDQQEKVMREAKDLKARYGKIGQMRETALDQVADNLERQMSDKSSNSGVRLLPQGTDLYVRRYESTRTAIALPDAHAAVVRIYGKPFVDDESNSAKADEDLAAQLKRTRSVRGKLLD